MAEIKISDLNPKGANLAVTDLLVISEDIGGGLYETKSITGDEVLNAVAKTAVAVRNQTGATIYKGTIVYISGASGGKALISKAQANSEVTSSKTLGVVTADIANNANGNVLTNGLLTDLDTRTTATNPFTADTLAIGDDLYLSPTNAGYVTNIKPIAPNNLVNIGKVLETSATTGQILYAIVNGYELGELHDVDTTGAVTGNVLALDGGIWKPTTISTGLTIGTTPITGGTVGRVLFEGAGNVMQEDSAFFWDNTNKRLGVGATPATTVRLDVRAQGALSTDIAFRVRNSVNTINNFAINGKGHIEARANNNNQLYLGGSNVDNADPSYYSVVVVGYSNTNAGYRTTIIGSENTNNSTSKTTILGHQNTNTGDYSIIIGHNNTNQNGVVIGRGNATFGVNSPLVFGDNNKVSANSGYPTKALLLIGSNLDIPNDIKINNSIFFGTRDVSGSAHATLNHDNFMISSMMPTLANYDINSRGVFYTKNGTAPTTLPVDSIAMYSADIIAGNAAPHFRTENGSVIKLYKQNLATNPTNAEIATFLSNLGLANLI